MSVFDFLILIAAFTWLLLITGCCVGVWWLWRRRGMRKWLADFDQGLEREERVRANFQCRRRFRP